MFNYERVNELENETWVQAETRLREELLRFRPEDLDLFLEQKKEHLITGQHPFADFMRDRLREKGILQQEVFLAADLPERYGYKLLSGQKRTRQRGVILRLCLVAALTPEEAQEALLRYGMVPLRARIPRDAALLVAFQNRLFDIHAVDALLRENGLTPLLP